MIASAELREWLDSRSAQQVTGDRTVRLAQAWDASPAAMALRAALAGCPPTIAAVRAALAGTLADTGWVTGLLAMLRRELAVDAFVQLPFRPMPNAIGDGLLLLSQPLASISLVVVDAARLAEKKRTGAVGKSIRFSGRCMVGAVVRGSATIRRFAGDAPRPDWRAAAAPPCRIGDTERWDTGALFAIDGRSEAYTFLETDADFVFVQCEIACEAAPLSIEYDAATCRLLGASTTDAQASRAMMMLSCLATLGAAEAGTAFDRGLASPHFHVRWHAMREYLAVQPGAAWDAMARMAADDPHPDIRSAAARAMAGRTHGEPTPCHA